jgi:endonuclease YncB( thermonuclease family)
LVAIALLAMLLAAPSASARKAPCIPGQKKPKCLVWQGKVGAVDDGDTLNVRINGQRKRGLQRIRITGIQAMELTKYGKKAGRRGYCTGVEATELLERFIRRGRSRVRIAAISASSRAEGNRVRLRRSLLVKIGGKWVDPAAEVLKAGLALWFPNAKEWAWNKKYAKLAAEAQARGVGLFSPTACGATAPSPLVLKVKWDANGTDNKNLNGEWVRVTNTDPLLPISLAGYTLRDSHLRPQYRFPGSAVLAPGASLRVFVGRGRDSGNSFYWGLNEGIFENVEGGKRSTGDGAYLFNRAGALRAWLQYPCRVGCRDALAGKVALAARFRGPEWVAVVNISAQQVNLNQYEIESSPWFFEFDSNTILNPGQRLILFVKKGRSRNRFFNWDFKTPLFADKKDAVTLRNPRGQPVACFKWGKFKCPGV